MMDVIMLAVLLVCFGSMKLFTDWCDRQTRTAATKEGDDE